MVYKSHRLLKTSCIGFVLSSCLLSSAAFADALKVGVVGNAQGGVSATSVEGVRRALATGNDIFENDTIRTEAASRAQMLFLDKSALTLTPGSEVKIDKFVYNPASTGDGNLSLNGVKGAFRFIGGALSKENHVTVKTPVSTIGIRGGILETHISPDGGTADAIFVYGHDMTVQDTKGQQVVVTDFGGGVNVQKGAATPVTLTPAKVEQKLQQFNAGAQENSGNTGSSSASSKADSPAASSSESKKEESGASGNESGSGSSSDSGSSSSSSGNSNSSSAGDNGASGASSTSSSSTTQSGSSANSGASAGASSRSPIELTSSIISNTMATASGNAINLNAQGQVAAVTQEGRYRVNSIVADPSQSIGVGSTQAAQNLSQGTSRATLTKEGLATIFQEVVPGTAKQQIATLPVPQSGQAFGTISSVQLGTDTYYGKVYTSGNGMFYYLLRNTANTKELSFVVGNSILKDKWLSAVEKSAAAAVNQDRNGITFYHVLPTVGGNSGDTGNSERFLQDATNQGFSNSGSGGNIAVDWNNKKFLGASVKWGGKTDGFGADSNMVVNMGNVTPEGNQLMNGKLYDYSQGTGAQSNTEKAGVTNGLVRTTQLIYGAPDGPITGFVFDAIEAGSFNSTSGERILAPATAIPGSATAIADTHKKTVGTMKGYAAGYVIDYITGTNPTATAYWNNAPEGVTVSKSVTDNTISATIAVFDLNHNKPTLDARFGSYEGLSGDSVFIDDKLFAATQALVKSGNTTITSGTAQSGVLLSGESFTEVTNRCTSCDYVQWGIWAGEGRVTGNGNATTRVASMIPVVMGQPTLNTADLANLGTVRYDGAMYGTTLNNNTKALTQQDGSFFSNIDLSNRKLNNFQGSIGGNNFRYNGNPIALVTQGSGGSAGIGFGNIAVSGTSGSNINGTVNGSLFGPQAQNIGGNFNINNTGIGTSTSTSTTGVYLGSRMNPQ